jgi:hypothetical protein
VAAQHVRRQIEREAERVVERERRRAVEHLAARLAQARDRVVEDRHAVVDRLESMLLKAKAAKKAP